MTQEELINLIKEKNQNVANTDIPNIINPIMGLYEKGIQTGMEIGKQLSIAKACEWLKNSLHNTRDICGYKQVASLDSCDISEFIEYFKRAMEE